jgi:hypothetical protein
MAAPAPGTPAYYRSRATPLPKLTPQPVPGTPAWYQSRATPIPPAPPAKAGKLTTQVARNTGTPQGSLTQIESMDQIEARVRRLADENFTRQQSVLDTQAERLRKDAEGRRISLQNAYATAAQMNANLGGNVQGGWNEAARTIQGLANTGTGAVSEGLQADLATQEQALSRVGAGGTGFDARSQAGVEAYRGGTLPGEFFARQGGAGNQWMNQNAIALNQRGLQEGIATEQEEIAKSRADYDEQLAKLQTGRSDYEESLRKQLLGARSDQITALEKAAEKVADIRKAQADLRWKYFNAKLQATTKGQLQQIEMINEQADRDLKLQMGAALDTQRYASANLSDVRAQNLTDYPTGAPKPPKPPSPTAISTSVQRAQKTGAAVVQQVMDNIWAAAPGHSMPDTFEKGKPFKDRLALYQTSPEFQEAIKWRDRQYTRSFGTAHSRVYKAIHDGLKALGYNDAKIRDVAYQIVSAKIKAPANWGGGRPAPAPPPAAFTGGINLNPGGAPALGV